MGAGADSSGEPLHGHIHMVGEAASINGADGFARAYITLRHLATIAFRELCSFSLPFLLPAGLCRVQLPAGCLALCQLDGFHMHLLVLLRQCAWHIFRFGAA